jgi:hypothetical protein
VRKPLPDGLNQFQGTAGGADVDQLVARIAVGAIEVKRIVVPIRFDLFAGKHSSALDIFTNEWHIVSVVIFEW